MKYDDDLAQQLRRPPAPDDLEAKIRANWQEQQLKSQTFKSLIRVAVAAGFTLLIAATLVFNGNVTPNDLISIAINDIHKDGKQNIGITLPVESIFRQAHIQPPPESMPVKMTKLCTLNGNKTMHLKVAGAKRGEVHLFIKEGQFDTVLLKSETDTMPWKLIKPRDDLSVLVLYSKDMNPANVDKLIQTMFYA